ncbi:MAG: hypothetical protein ABI682_14330 [Acidobacteriota bacterium]
MSAVMFPSPLRARGRGLRRRSLRGERLAILGSALLFATLFVLVG